MNELMQRLTTSPVLYREQPVITLKMMDDLHERPEGTAGRNFREHRSRLVEGEDYFEVPQSELPQRLFETTNFVDSNDGRGGARRDQILLTESGYLLLVKSFRDDRAWEVQRKLVSAYFRAKERAMTDGERFFELARLNLANERRLAQHDSRITAVENLARAALGTATSNYGRYSVLAYANLTERKLTYKEASRHGKELSATCRNLGIAVEKVKDPRFGLVNVYPEDVLKEHFGDN